MVSCWVGSEASLFHFDFVVHLMVPPLVENRESPEFHDLMRKDKAHWPRCWLPMLSGVNGASPWAADASESAGHLVEAALGRYSSGLLAECAPPDEFGEARASGFLFYAHQTEDCWGGRRWSHVDRVRPKGEVQSCRGFCSVPGPLQSVQRAEMWGVILALQSSCGSSRWASAGWQCWLSSC